MSPLAYDSDRNSWTYNLNALLGHVYTLDLDIINGHSSSLVRKLHYVLILQSAKLSRSSLRICVPLTHLKPNKHLKDPNGLVNTSNLKFPHQYILYNRTYTWLHGSYDAIVETNQILTIEKTYLPDQNFQGQINNNDILAIITKIAGVLGVNG
jgi:hypothetical protein